MRALPGIATIEGSTPGLRRAALARLDDEATAERLTRMALALREIDATGLAAAACLPLAEVVASPFALRAVAMGVSVGATTRHLELRRSIDWPARLGHAEVEDPDHGAWDRGVLRTGKYQGFMTDAPFASYDPAHVSKWGPHELLHRAAGFFFRAGASRWELYLGARLNELVPVVTWYGAEQVLRLDEGPFDREAAGRRPAARTQDARWRTRDEGALREAALGAVGLFRAGLAHFERELAAIDEELVTGRRVRAPHPVLDASSDATAYVVGHSARLSTAAVCAVLEAVPGDVRADDVGVYRDRVEALFDRLLFGTLEVDLALSARRREARVAWDLLHRAAHLGEGVEDDLEALLPAMSALLSEDEETAPPDPAALLDAVQDALGEEEAEPVLEDGHPGREALSILGAGIDQVAPCTFALLDALDDARALAVVETMTEPSRARRARLARLTTSARLFDRAPLVVRLQRWLEDEDAPLVVRDMLALEAAIATARRDDGVERLCVPEDELPESLRAGVVIANEASRVVEISHDVLTVHAELSAGARVEPPPRAAGALLVTAFFDGVSVVPLPDVVRAAYERARLGVTEVSALVDAIDAAELPAADGWPSDGEAWIRELVIAGALGYR